MSLGSILAVPQISQPRAHEPLMVDQLSSKINKVLVVGAGSIAKRHVAVVRAKIPDAVIGVLRQDNTKCGLENVQHKLGGPDEILEFQPDVAIICSPAPLHCAHAAILTRQGVPVLIEKPLGASQRDIAPLLQAIIAAPEINRLVHVAYNLRFSESLNFFADAITSKKIGNVLSVRAEVGQHLEHWRPNTDYKLSVSALRDKGGGVLRELSHELDYIRWIFGDVSWVQSSISRVNNFNIDVEEVVHLVLGIKDKAFLIRIDLDFVRQDAKRECVVIGDQGTLIWDGLEGSVKLRSPLSDHWELLFREEADIHKSYERQWDYFCSANESKSEPRIGFADALDTMKLIFAAEKSDVSLGQRMFVGEMIE